MSKLYDYIERLCKARGENVTTLAKNTHIARTCFSELKAGRIKSLSYKTMKTVADYFGISVETLSNCGEDIPKPQIGSFAFALYNETKGLSQEQKDLLMRLARDMNSRKD